MENGIIKLRSSTIKHKLIISHKPIHSLRSLSSLHLLIKLGRRNARRLTLQAARGMLHWARQNFRTFFFQHTASAIIVNKFSSDTCKANFRTSTAHANFGLPLHLIFAWTCSVSVLSANTTCRNTSFGGFLKIFPNTHTTDVPVIIYQVGPHLHMKIPQR